MISGAVVEVKLVVKVGRVGCSSFWADERGGRPAAVVRVERTDVERHGIEAQPGRESQLPTDTDLRLSVSEQATFQYVVVTEGSVRIAVAVVREEQAVLGDVVIAQPSPE